MAIRETLELDLSRALSQLDDLERQLDSLLQPIEIPIDSDQVTLTAQEFRKVQAAIEAGVEPAQAIARATGRVEFEADQAEDAIRGLSQALDISEDEAAKMVVEFQEGRVEAGRIEAAIREVSQALDLSEQDARELAQQMSRAASETREMSGVSRTAGGGVGFLGGNLRGLITTLGAYVGAREFINFARDSIAAASDLEESLSKTEVVFGDFAEEIVTFSTTAPQALGLSNAAALETTATFGNLFVALGLTEGAAADLAPEIVQLGADLASFNNIEVDEALVALRSGLVGEVEPLRRLGVAINAAVVEAKALELGLVDASGELTEAAKVQARYALIVEQTSVAQGDFARTADGIANRQRTLAGNFENLQASIGEALLPAYEDLLAAAEDLLPTLIDTAPALGELAGGFADVLTPIIQLLGPLGELASLFNLVKEDAQLLQESDNDLKVFFGTLSEGLTTGALSFAAEQIDNLRFAIETGFKPTTITKALDDIEAALEGSTDPVFTLITRFGELAEAGEVTAGILNSIIDAADLDTQNLLKFLREAEGLEGLSADELEAIRDALTEVTVGLFGAADARADFEAATGQTELPEFVATLDDVNAALERVQFERATGQLEELQGAFANFDTSIFFDIEVPDLSSQIDDIKADIGELPDAFDATKEALKDSEGEIVEDFGEFFASLETELAARAQFAENINLLRSLGFDDLADQFEAAGIDSAAALADGLDDPASLARAEAALERYAANIDQIFIERTAAAVAEATDNIDDLIAKINEVEGLSSTAKIQVLFEAIGAIDSRVPFESNITAPTNVPATQGGDTNIVINQGPSEDPGTTATRTAQAVASVVE